MGQMQILMGILIAVAMLLTLGVLFSGLVVMARGGETNRKYGNALMRWRVICQGIALALIAIAFLIGSSD